MKKTNEMIIARIKIRYANEMKDRDSMKRYSVMEEENNHHKKSQEYEHYAELHQAVMNELSDMYSFITGINWVDSVKELQEYAKGIRG